MTELGVEVPPHRATILVGYGGFGRAVLRRLLASTAPRGVLRWEDSRGGAAPSERHLQDLSLLYIPESSMEEQADYENAREGAALEMMRDLYRQIDQVGDGASSDGSFADALSTAAESMLSAASRAGRTRALPLGLDVIVLAQPTSREAVGTLDRLLVRGMGKLANNANLQRAVQGSEALNFIAVFDFENYWDSSERGRSIRRAVHDSIEQWQKRRVSNKPAFGRVYFVDGRTDDGFRSGFDRVDEISLLLEFLLFEGQRGGDLPRLYQPAGKHESAVATFGIRLVERSAGLLAHLAAARFGIGWLDYLAGVNPSLNAAESHLRQRMKPFEPEALDQFLDASALRRDLEAELSDLERKLTALSFVQDWPERVRSAYEETLASLEVRIAGKARAMMAEVSAELLSQLSTELRAGINEDLHDERNPVPIGGVIAELKQLLGRLQAIPSVTPPPPGEAEELLRRIEKLHTGYGQFDSDRIEIEGHKRWWPLLALALSAGLTPIVHELIGEIPKPDPMRFLLDRGYALLQWVNNPLIIAVLMFIAAWLIGAKVIHGSIAARIERSRRFYNDPDRGRFVDLLRNGLKPGGALRAPIDYLVDRLLYEMALSVRGDVTRELGRVLARLETRSNEIRWLREQLRGFLRMNGFTGENFYSDAGALHRNGSGIRHAMERDTDLDAMLRGHAPGNDRYRSTQISHPPFGSWDERYSRSFLAPLEFLDRLSEIYRDPFEQELARPGDGPEQKRLARELLDFLRTRGTFSLAFGFKAQEGVPPDQRYCLFPPLWQRLESVPAALSDLRMGSSTVLSGTSTGRGYLLRLQAGVDPKCLLEPE